MIYTPKSQWHIFVKLFTVLLYCMLTNLPLWLTKPF